MLGAGQQDAALPSECVQHTNCSVCIQSPGCFWCAQPVSREWKGRRTAALMQGYRVTRGNLKHGVIWKVSSHSTKNGANRLIIHHNQAQCTTIPACQNFGRRRWCYRDSGNFIEICSLSHVLKTLLRQNQIFDGILR